MRCLTLFVGADVLTLSDAKSASFHARLQKIFLSKSETVFESKFVNPRLMEDGKLTYSFSFETKEEAENHH